jgi:hypothetical protein
MQLVQNQSWNWNEDLCLLDCLPHEKNILLWDYWPFTYWRQGEGIISFYIVIVSYMFTVSGRWELLVHDVEMAGQVSFRRWCGTTRLAWKR